MTLYDFIKENKLEMYILYMHKTDSLDSGLFIPSNKFNDFLYIAKDFLNTSKADFGIKSRIFYTGTNIEIAFDQILDLIEYNHEHKNEKPLAEYRDLFRMNDFEENEYDVAILAYNRSRIKNVDELVKALEAEFLNKDDLGDIYDINGIMNLYGAKSSEDVFKDLKAGDWIKWFFPKFNVNVYLVIKDIKNISLPWKSYKPITIKDIMVLFDDKRNEK